MLVVLEITSEPGAGRKIWLRRGESARVGRTARACFSVETDSTLSELHFAMDCDGKYCRLRDLDSLGGTYRNGQRVAEAVLENHDTIRAGETTFRVQVEGGAQVAAAGDDEFRPPETAGGVVPTRPSEHAVGTWRFSHVPDGWDVVSGQGLKRVMPGGMGSSVMVSEGPLPEGVTLDGFRRRIPEQLAAVAPAVEQTDPAEIEIPGAEEAIEVSLRHTTVTGVAIVQRQVFARLNGSLATATLIASADEPQDELDDIIAGLALTNPT